MFIQRAKEFLPIEIFCFPFLVPLSICTHVSASKCWQMAPEHTWTWTLLSHLVVPVGFSHSHEANTSILPLHNRPCGITPTVLKSPSPLLIFEVVFPSIFFLLFSQQWYSECRFAHSDACSLSDMTEDRALAALFHPNRKHLLAPAAQGPLGDRCGCCFRPEAISTQPFSRVRQGSSTLICIWMASLCLCASANVLRISLVLLSLTGVFFLICLRRSFYQCSCWFALRQTVFFAPSETQSHRPTLYFCCLWSFVAPYFVLLYLTNERNDNMCPSSNLLSTKSSNLPMGEIAWFHPFFRAK